jgi:hypothetical protein
VSNGADILMRIISHSRSFFSFVRFFARCLTNFYLLQNKDAEVGIMNENFDRCQPILKRLLEILGERSRVLSKGMKSRDSLSAIPEFCGIIEQRVLELIQAHQIIIQGLSPATANRELHPDILLSFKR